MNPTKLKKSLQLCMSTIQNLSDHLNLIYTAMNDPDWTPPHDDNLNVDDSDGRRDRDHCEYGEDVNNKISDINCASTICSYCLDAIKSGKEANHASSCKHLNNDASVLDIGVNKKPVKKIKPPIDGSLRFNSYSDSSREVVLKKSKQVKRPYKNYGQLDKNRPKNIRFRKNNKTPETLEKQNKSPKALIKELDRILDEFVDNPHIVLKCLSRKYYNYGKSSDESSVEEPAQTNTIDNKYHRSADNIKVRTISKPHEDQDNSSDKIRTTEDKSRVKSKSPSYNVKLNPEDIINVKVDMSPVSDLSLTKSGKKSQRYTGNSACISEHKDLSDTPSNISFGAKISTFQTGFKKLNVVANNCNDISQSTFSSSDLNYNNYCACCNCDNAMMKSKMTKMPTNNPIDELGYYRSPHDSNPTIKQDKPKNKISVLLSDLKTSHIYAKHSLKNTRIQPVVVPANEEDKKNY